MLAFDDLTSATKAAAGADVICFCAARAYPNWTKSFYALQEAAIAAARKTGAVLVAAENLYGYGVAGTLHEGLPLTATTCKGAVRARMSKRPFAAHDGDKIRAVFGRAWHMPAPKTMTGHEVARRALCCVWSA
ncbi:MAG: hypothetical protein HC783_00715 [Rhodobacteraceae bacterium]|nr:hypothetical protein [Paracoccaceae bacterium]